MGGPDERQRRGGASLAPRREGADRRGGPRRPALLRRLPRRSAPGRRASAARSLPALRRRSASCPCSSPRLAAADPVFAGLPRELLTLQWHGDTFSLPDGAVLLASSPAYPNQAFRWGRYAYGVQFHLELSREMAAEWADVPEYADALARVLGPDSATALDRPARGQCGRAAGARAADVRALARALLPGRVRGRPRWSGLEVTRAERPRPSSATPTSSGRGKRRQSSEYHWCRPGGTGLTGSGAAAGRRAW